MLIEYLNIPNELWKGIYATGSRVICNPPVLDTDIDFIICERGGGIELHKFLIKNGFNKSCKDDEEYDMESEGFECYRKDNINLIITSNYNWYLKWVTATKLAKKLNLLEKEQRIALFKYVLYGGI